MFDDNNKPLFPAGQGNQNLNQTVSPVSPPFPAENKGLPPSNLPTGGAPNPPKFSETTANKPVPPAPLPDERPLGDMEDIFDGVDRGSMPPSEERGPLPGGVFPLPGEEKTPRIGIEPQVQNEAQNLPVPPEQMMAGVEEKRLSPGKKILIIIVSVILIAALAGLGFWLYQKLTAGEELPAGIEGVEENYESEIVPEETETGEETEEEGEDAEIDEEYTEELGEPESAAPADVDSDGDGLTDGEEQFLGTDINSSDSDEDGLPDRDEVEIYKTDPLNPDSDEDGYLDGDEVGNGYNPKGPGRLLNLP